MQTSSQGRPRFVPIHGTYVAMSRQLRHVGEPAYDVVFCGGALDGVSARRNSLPIVIEIVLDGSGQMESYRHACTIHVGPDASDDDEQATDP